MPHTITQNPALNNSLSVPTDAIDDVNQNSVDPVFQNLLNNDYYNFSQLVNYRPYLNMISTNGTSVVVAPFYGMWTASTNGPAPLDWVAISNTAFTSVTAANLDTGMAFMVGKPYYIYAYYVSPGVMAFECSLVPPDVRNIFKSTPDYSRRYIGSFVVSGGGTIFSFIMVNNEYKIDRYFLATNHNTANQTDYTFDLIAAGYPVTMKYATINGGISTSAVNITGLAQITIYPNTLPNLNNIYIMKAQVIGVVDSLAFTVETGLVSGVFGYSIFSDTVNDVSTTLDMVGYKE